MCDGPYRNRRCFRKTLRNGDKGGASDSRVAHDQMLSNAPGHVFPDSWQGNLTELLEDRVWNKRHIIHAPTFWLLLSRPQT